MFDSKYFKKVTDSNNPRRVGTSKHDDSKTQPAKPTWRGGNVNGDSHDFNIKGKITSNSGSDYHDVHRPSSGLHGNFAEKDAQAAYLKERGMKGQVVKHFAGTEEKSRLHTHNVGPTAYNSRPIDEVYTPGTSRNVPPSNAVYRPIDQKTETKG